MLSDQVQRTDRFIQNHDSAVLEDCPRQIDETPLTVAQGFQSPAGKLREAAAAEKEEHADPSGDHRAADHGHEAAERHGETPRKERKSVLARLNDKKEMLSSQPKKDVPSRSKSAELG